MAKRRRHLEPKRPKQGVLFPGIEESHDESDDQLLVPFNFLDVREVRATMIKGELWLVGVDCCRAMEITKPWDALSRLDDEQMMILRKPDERGRLTDYNVINVSGLYELVFESRKPVATDFRKWVTKVVLPTLARTGRFELPTRRRALTEKRRLKCDYETAVARAEQIACNREDNARLRAEGVNLAEWHDGGYIGQYGKRARQLRPLLDQSPRQTPLDRMSATLLCQNLHAKAVANQTIAELRRAGNAVDPGQQPAILEDTARLMMDYDCRVTMPGHTWAVIDDPKRGKILELVPKAQILNPPSPGANSLDYPIDLNCGVIPW